MPKVFLAPYHSNLHKEVFKAGTEASDVFRAYAAASRQPYAWPYDNGDDPSFFSSWYLDAPLTWGVCRGDLRNKICNSSAVVFFAYTDFENRTQYRISGIATVSHKIQQFRIFSDKDQEIFQNYLNLLISPHQKFSQRWRWVEPCFPKGQHDNWPWRLADRSIFQSSDFVRYKRLPDITVGQLVNGKPYKFGRNYVIFSMNETDTFIIDNPPIIADSFSGNAEVWRQDAFSQGVLSLTLKCAKEYGTSDRGLRIPGTPYPHSRAASWEVDDQTLETWRSDFFLFLLKHGFRPRSPRTQ
jgi:hypothetical protein